MQILEEIQNTTARDFLTQMLRSLEGHFLCLFVFPDDGHIQRLRGKNYHTEVGGPEYLLGQVMTSGIETRVDGPEPWVKLKCEGSTYYRVFLNGVAEGFVFDHDSLLKLLREALQGDDGDKLKDVLIETGFRRM